MSTANEENVDIYRLKIGVRTLHWNSKQFLINGKPIYFRGFGRHEDSDVMQLVNFFFLVFVDILIRQLFLMVYRFAAKV